MAPNEVFRFNQAVSMPVPAGTKSGDPVQVGLLNGVAQTDVAKTDVAAFNEDGSVNQDYNWGGGNPHGSASVWLFGGHRLNVASASAPAFGSAVYYDPATKGLTATKGSLALFGVVTDVAPIDNGGGSFATLVKISEV